MNHSFSGRRSHFKTNSNKHVVSISIGKFYDLKDIKTEMKGNKLKVSGSANETLKHGCNKHVFEREYEIPNDMDLSTLKTKLAIDGTLHISFKRKHVEPKKDIEYLSTKQEFKVRINVEGFKRDEISVRVIDRDLTVEATRKSEVVNEDGTKTKSSSKHISRTISLGDDVEVDHLRVVHTNGSIEVSAPKDPDRAHKKARKLEIEQE
ncbi:hypothetical protein RF11_02948 [Thelohanellus kitauei]|uniref:SHSP domain-containing protein n=1 Tax=Thelohanellus kitauei TaxID=669202 RepID=A0A0C2NBS5_THEKT|nr:hypothetical protein RF11_02948 [Thelohanellus kitauei]